MDHQHNVKMRKGLYDLLALTEPPEFRQVAALLDDERCTEAYLLLSSLEDDYMYDPEFMRLQALYNFLRP